jgi:Uma2 family endonuclease
MQPESPSANLPPAEDPFRYGWRYVKESREDGSEEWRQVPLTLEDVLHPQEEDHIPVRPLHEIDCTYLVGVFRTRPLQPALWWVTLDLRIDWGFPAVGCHSPDIAVFVGLRHEPDLEKGTLDLTTAGGHCVLALEVVSPDRRRVDVVDKFQEYHQVGVPLYIIVDQDGEQGPREIRGYRHTPQGYQLLPLTAEGRLPLPGMGLWLGFHDRRVACFDATGKEVGDYTRISEELEEADRRNHEQALALEENISELKTLQRQTAEEKRVREAAETRAAEELRAREAAEKRAADEQRSREAAEKRAADEQRVREEAERRVRELENLLKQLQNPPPAAT